MPPVVFRSAALSAALRVGPWFAALATVACSGTAQSLDEPASAGGSGPSNAEAGLGAGTSDTGVDSDAGAIDSALDQGVESEVGSACAPTQGNILGPYYKPDAPERDVLVEPADPGVRLTLSGRVLSTECAPIGDVLLDFWQADAAGAYDMIGFKFRGRLHASASGTWKLETIVPGRYLNAGTYRPAHIHVKVDSPGMAPLITQLYFDDDPFNANDGFILPSLIMHVEGPPEGPRTASFDFVLPRL